MTSTYSPGTKMGAMRASSAGPQMIVNQNDNPNLMRLSGGSYKQMMMPLQPNQMNGGAYMDTDPYAPTIVQDLLSGSHDWKNI